MKQNNRLLALDVLRGITVAGMILVNDPGSWGAVYAPLRHAVWNGLTPTDLVFPFFMFIMGVSMFFSLRKFDFVCSRQVLLKILRRGFLIFMLGLGITWFAQWFGAVCNVYRVDLPLGERLWKGLTDVSHLRILGVLQRLAIAYVGGSLISLWIRPRYYLWTAAAILLGYFFILWGGNGFELSESNIIARVDQAVFGAQHLYGEYLPGGQRIAFDPEGLLSALPGFAHVLLGMFVGRILTEIKDNEVRVLQLLIYGTILVFTGYLLSYGCPVNKKIWSPTYVMMTCGLAAQLLALLIFVIDIKGYRLWSRFFEAFGVNPLFTYVLADLIAIVLGFAGFYRNGEYISIQNYIYSVGLASWMNPYLASLVFALLFVVLNWGIARVLYKRKIYIKI